MISAPECSPGTPDTRRVILYVCASSSTFIHHHLRLAESAARFMDVHAALNLDRPDDAAVLAAKGIRVHGFSLTRKSGNPLRVLREAIALRGIIKSVRPDIINPITLKSVLTAALASLGLPIFLVGTVTGLGYMYVGDSFRQRALRNMTRWGLVFALGRIKHTLVFSNRDDRREFLEQGITTAERVEIIPVPGVDVDEFCFTPEPETGFRVLLPARMLWDKGVGEFVEAARRLQPVIPEAEFILAGDVDDGNPATVTREHLAEWAREGVVNWLGHYADMPGLLASCHVVCLPSYYKEGFPRVMVEAMACGRAVIATDVSGCRDALDGSGAGVLVSPRDPGALAEAVLDLYHDVEKRQEMGRHGRIRVEEALSSGLITRKILACYAELLKEGASKPILVFRKS